MQSVRNGGAGGSSRRASFLEKKELIKQKMRKRKEKYKAMTSPSKIYVAPKSTKALNEEKEEVKFSGEDWRAIGNSKEKKKPPSEGCVVS